MLKLPIPRLLGGVPEVISAPASPELTSYVKGLVARAERIRDGGVDPRIDNMLAVTTDGRKAALDMRLINPHASDHPYSKINQLVRNALQIWQDTAAQHLTQIMFCDLSRPRPEGEGFSVYNDVRGKLALLGVPIEQIAFIQDYHTDRAKAELFRAVREGRIRLLLGSTETMGVGTNLQDLLFCIHHLDAPWRPSDVEQRDGRMMRRGNTNAFCRILRYVTEGSFDAYVWQHLTYKLGMISSVVRGDATERRAEDADAVVLSYAQIKAIASGNLMVIEEAETSAALARLARAEAAFFDRQIQTRLELEALPSSIARMERRLAQVQADQPRREDTRGERFRIELEGAVYTERPEAQRRLRQIVIQASYDASTRTLEHIGRFAGFDLQLSSSRHAFSEIIISGEGSYARSFHPDEVSGPGLLQMLEHLPTRLDNEAQDLENALAHRRNQTEELQRILDEPFSQGEELTRLRARQQELARLLSNETPERQDLGGLDEATLDDDPEEEQADAA